MSERPTQAELLKLLEYDPATGLVRRRTSVKDCAAGAVAGCVIGTKHRYKFVCVHGRRYPLQNLIWVMMTGAWPDRIVDHKDTYGPKYDWGNRWANLRLADISENARNRRLQSNNTSGHTGVYPHTKARGWRVFIKFRGKWIYIGSFRLLEDAIRARREAEAAYFGDFAPQRIAA